MRKLRRRLRFAWDGRFGPLPRPERWVFIVGCYNSGTTLLHDILATHPRVGSMPWEGQFYTDELPLPLDFGLPRLWAIEPERFALGPNDGAGIDVARLKRQWGARLNDPSRPILIEKSPTNAGRTRWLARHFENAHFIGIVRNGYAVAEGIRRKAGHRLELGARQWAVSNEIMLRDFEQLPNQMIVRYEELASDLPAVLDRVGGFIGISADGLTGLGAEWRVHGHERPIRNLNGESFASMTEDELTEIRAAAGIMLDRLGYDVEPALSH